MKEKRPYLEMISVAESVKKLLAPHCFRLEIAGSLRRKCELISDIEIVAIPKIYDTGLFESGIATVVNKWEKVKGELEFGKCKYTQRLLPEGIKLDLFFASPVNYGIILLIRTGDWEFSKKFMGTILPQRGYKCENGFLKYNGKIIDTREEIDLFDRMKINYISPENRNITNT